MQPSRRFHATITYLMKTTSSVSSKAISSCHAVHPSAWASSSESNDTFECKHWRSLKKKIYLIFPWPIQQVASRLRRQIVCAYVHVLRPTQVRAFQLPFVFKMLKEDMYPDCEKCFLNHSLHKVWLVWCHTQYLKGERITEDLQLLYCKVLVWKLAG